MKILVLGATGPTGRHVLDRALDAGDHVTALARTPAALRELDGRIDVVGGDATSVEDLTAAVAGHDAVLSCLGRGSSISADGMFSRAADALLPAMASTGVRRLVWLSSFGVGHTYRDASTVQKLTYRSFLRWIYADKERAERAIRATDLDWTLVYPTRLTHDPARGAFRAQERIEMSAGDHTIGRADLGAFLHRAVHEDRWIRRDAVVTD